MAVNSFKINISESELQLLRQKLSLARLAPQQNPRWAEQNGVNPKSMREIIKFWLEDYDWRTEEARLNELPQFITSISCVGFGAIDVHFVHSKSAAKNALPMLFLHGWPGSFMEIIKALPLLNDAGLTVVAPSLPGHGFSSYPDEAGFDHRKHAEVLNALMLRLGYHEYVVQGGDWGSELARTMGLLHADHVKAVHQNMISLPKPNFPEGEPEYTALEQARLKRALGGMEDEGAYAAIHSQKPMTFGIGMHDSPVAMLAWMCDKLFLWTDKYPWTPTELITWTLLHYFPGPTTAFVMYREQNPLPAFVEGSYMQKYSKVPHGISAFAQEVEMYPRSWVETIANVQFWSEHDCGGHFAMYEQPELLAADVAEFFKSVWTV